MDAKGTKGGASYRGETHSRTGHPLCLVTGSKQLALGDPSRSHELRHPEGQRDVGFWLVEALGDRGRVCRVEEYADRPNGASRRLASPRPGWRSSTHVYERRVHASSLYGDADLQLAQQLRERRAPAGPPSQLAAGAGWTVVEVRASLGRVSRDMQTLSNCSWRRSPTGPLRARPAFVCVCGGGTCHHQEFPRHVG